MTFTHEGNKTFIDNLVNFEKMVRARCCCFFFQMKFASVLIKEIIFLYAAMLKGELHIKELRNPWFKLAASLLCQSLL